MFVGRRVRVGWRDGSIGGIYGGAFVDISLVLVVGVGLGICCPLIEAHGGGGARVGSQQGKFVGSRKVDGVPVRLAISE